MKNSIRLLFTAIFLIISSYIIFIESERYESTSIALLKDLTEKQEMNLGEMLLGHASGTTQDSKVLELYIRSNEMYDYLDEEYNLTKHYASEHLDVMQRLYNNALLPRRRTTKRNLLEKYNQDLSVSYDDLSGTLSISTIHTDPKIAKQMLESIYIRANEIINSFAKENAKVALHFIEKIRDQNRELFIRSIKKLIAYQNKHHTIDPSVDVERKSTILAELESELVKNEVDYSSKLQTWNPKGKEMRMHKEIIVNLKKSIQRVITQMVGSDRDELNKNVFDFELLKSDMEFSKEVYRQTLINQEKLKLEVSQQSRHLIIVAKPSLSDDYSYPNKLWDIFTWLIVLLFFYSSLITIITIVKDHKD